jgi:hypothetical protein
MQAFEEFYDIRLNVPENELPSFAYTRVDAYARIYPREYGTIVPREVDSVETYDPDTLAYMLADYLAEVRNEYKIVDVVVIMKPDAQFREQSLLAFFEKRISMLCVRGGLAINVDGEPQTVCDPFPSSSLSDWDCEILGELENGLNMEDPERALYDFKTRFPSAMVGYVAPDVNDEPPPPVKSFREQANEQVREVINYFSKRPYSEIHGPKATVYDFHNGSKITVNATRLTVRNSKGESNWRTKLDSTKDLVIDLLRDVRPVQGPFVGERMFRSIAQQLDSSVHDIEIEGDVLVAFKLDSKISVHFVERSVVANFDLGGKLVTATLQAVRDFDAFVVYLEKMLNATKATVWKPE